jgi:hypothetical protein
MLYNSIIDEWENPIVTALIAYEWPREETLNYKWEEEWNSQKQVKQQSRV